MTDWSMVYIILSSVIEYHPFGPELPDEVALWVCLAILEIMLVYVSWREIFQLRRRKPKHWEKPDKEILMWCA
jgi:hypothetical protein